MVKIKRRDGHIILWFIKMQETGRIPKKVIIVIAIVAVAAMVSGYWIYQNYYAWSRPPWLFKGAYMKYYGEMKILGITASGTIYLEILDLNETHYKLLTYMKIDTPFGIRENQTIEWLKINEPLKNVINEYETTIYLDTLGITRNVLVMELQDNRTLYIDKKTEIPLKIEYKMKGGYSIILDLIETNVPLD